MQENDLWNRDRFQPWGWCTVENPGLGISSQLGQIVQVLTGHRTQDTGPQLSILSLSLALPSFHPIFPGCSCQHQHLAKLPRGFCPCCERLPTPPVTTFGDSVWRPGQFPVPCSLWEERLGRGEKEGETQRGLHRAK